MLTDHWVAKIDFFFNFLKNIEYVSILEKKIEYNQKSKEEM